MSLLYKRSNRLWHWLIRNQLVHRVWSPLVHLTRLRHLAFRNHLASRVPTETGSPTPTTESRKSPGQVVPAGV
jgi:hypothetical protein